ncbi:alpha/beta hydrolase domain-containing protein [Paraburkholderia sediminicola]|uniref:alpha/beta hydrolase domain-containing protein n=1 Tax=Paraburkholderia sediminicola TaxID=458836 RepID=UPI0038B7D2E3
MSLLKNKSRLNKKERSLSMGTILRKISIALVIPLTFAGCGGSTTKSSSSLPVIQGTIPADQVGSADHNYPFAAGEAVPDGTFEKYGYVEQEFFMQGTANVYNLPAPTGIADAIQAPTATVVTSGHPYKTRLIVRRPTDPSKFNGTVIVEWANVTSGYENADIWQGAHAYLINNGYAFVEVSAQNAGITATPNGLKSWSAARYGSLDVTDGGKVTADGLSFDIFSQAGAAIKANNGNLMGGLPVKLVLATGESQSAEYVSMYLNAVHPLANVFDGGILTKGGEIIRPDLNIPVMKILSESEFQDVSGGTLDQQTIIRPDRESTGPRGAGGYRTWEVAGTSHADAYSLLTRAPSLLRDLSISAELGCTLPGYSQIPFHYVLDKGIDAIVSWIVSGTAPAHAPSLTIQSVSPLTLARDSNGNALGGIRLPQFAVPVATNTGINSGPGLCVLRGSHVPFVAAAADNDGNYLGNPALPGSLYPSLSAYVSAIQAAGTALYNQGFMLQDSVTESVSDAQNGISPNAANGTTP